MPAGNIADLSLAIQNVKGTAATTANARAYLAGGGFGPIRETADLEETTSSRLRNAAFVSGYRAEGTPEFYVRPKMIGVLLYAAMGAKAVTGAADPWTHTFTLAATQPYLTVWRTLATLFERFADVKVAELNFSSAAQGALRVSARLLGLGAAFKTTAETAQAPETVDHFLHADGAGQFLVETVAASAISAIRINIGTGATIAYGDDVDGDSVNEGLQTITIETEQTIADFALWNRFHYGSATPADNAPPIRDVVELAGTGIDYTWSKRTSAGTQAAPARSLQFTATRLQIAGITGMDPNTSGEPLRRTVTYKVYQPAAGSGLTAVLKNGQATYTGS